jgi:hypothetical protein
LATKFGGKQRGGLTNGDPERRPAPLHHVVVKDGARGLEVLRVSLEGKGVECCRCSPPGGLLMDTYSPRRQAGGGM